MKSNFKIFLFIIIILITHRQTFVQAYDKDKVHPEINEYAVKQSSLDNVMKKQLGLPEGIVTIFQGKETWKWLREGGEFEDDGVRFLQHFHDPIQPWGNAGLKSLYRSSLVWAQDASLFNEFSWKWAREYYYQALISNSGDDFAKTFRALGQVMHLVSDASVPAHVRDDSHPFGDTYESWAKSEWDSLPYSGISINQSIFNQYIANSLAPVPISALWDQDSYNGANPPDPSNTTTGLAEYTNANFFSDDTVFVTYPDLFTVYPHPGYEDTNYGDIDWKNPEMVGAEDGKIDNRIYIKRVVGGESLYNLASVSYITLDCQLADYLYSPLVIDHKCHEDYAQRLVPRAVGYSAALLDYYFRGEIDMVPDEVNGDGYIVKNNSYEDLEGTFRLYYDNESDERIQIENGDFPLEISIPGNDKSSSINFTIPDNPKEQGKYILVFRGKLGNEQDAVVGKIVDINPYLLITIDGGFDRAMCFVWDIMENKFAHISDANSYPISFPCSKSELVTWLADSYSVGGALFDSLPGCDNTRLDVDCDTPNGCWDYNGDCTDEETRASSCVDADGSPLLNAARINRSDVDECFGAPYCADATRSLQKQITTEGSCYGGIRSMRLAVRNNSGIVTSVRAKEEYSQNYTKHYYNDGSGCHEMGLAYVTMDELIESKYTIFTPIGELVNYNLSQENYALWNYFVDLGQGNQTKESITGGGGAGGLYYGNVMVQLYYYDYLKKIETRPCGQIHWLVWVPWDHYTNGQIACDYDSIEYDDTLFSVCAQADVVNDPDNQDPTQLSRNNGLEGAIISLREEFENEYGNSSEDTLTNYIISIDLRIEK